MKEDNKANPKYEKNIEGHTVMEWPEIFTTIM